MNITQEQIEALKLRQADRTRHPYTCMGGSERTPDCKRRLSNEARRKGIEVEYSSDNKGILIPTEDGWVCPCGQYKQEIK